MAPDLAIAHGSSNDRMRGCLGQRTARLPDGGGRRRLREQKRKKRSNFRRRRSQSFTSSIPTRRPQLWQVVIAQSWQIRA